MVVAKLKVNNACEEEREMGTAEQQIQGDFLNMLTKEHVPVSVFLVNGIRLVGYIQSFDRYVLMLNSERVCKRYISMPFLQSRKISASPIR